MLLKNHIPGVSRRHKEGTRQARPQGRPTHLPHSREWSRQPENPGYWKQKQARTKSTLMGCVSHRTPKTRGRQLWEWQHIKIHIKNTFKKAKNTGDICCVSGSSCNSGWGSCWYRWLPTGIKYTSSTHQIRIKYTSKTHQIHIKDTSNIHQKHIKNTCCWGGCQ